MSDRAYIKLHRQITENEFYFGERFTRMQVWIDLLLLANHKPSAVYIRGIELRLRAGEMAYSQETLAKRWKWNFKAVKKFLKNLEKRQMVEVKTTNVTTVITIRNWNSYQWIGGQNGGQMESRTETDKNDKNGKKIIELTRPLLIGVKKESGLYSVLGRFNNELGEDSLREIVTGCVRRGKMFEDENELARYLGGCKRNGHPSRASAEGQRITNEVRTITADEPGWR